MMAAAPSRAGGATDLLYDPDLSITERFGSLTGIALRDEIFKCYRVGTRTLPFFNEAGDRMIIRHPCNNRVQESVKARYVAGLFRHGLMQGVRGACWAVLSPGGRPPYRVLSFGTLSEAVYAAHQQTPKHPLISASVAAGIPDAMLLHERTPLVVCRLLKDMNNQFHGGSGMQLPEQLQDVLSIQQSWNAHCKLNGLVWNQTSHKTDDDASRAAPSGAAAAEDAELSQPRAGALANPP